MKEQKFFIKYKGDGPNQKYHPVEVMGRFIPDLHGIKFFIHESHGVAWKEYSVTEYSTGGRLELGYTKAEAIANAKRKAKKLGKEKFIEGIEKIRKEHGIINH